MILRLRDWCLAHRCLSALGALLPIVTHFVVHS